MKSTAKILYKIFLAAGIFFTLNSCSKKTEPAISEEIQIQVEKKSSFYKWFALTKDGWTETESPQRSPVALKKPWTEALRISCMAQTESAPLETADSDAPKIYALTNRLGLLLLSKNGIKVFKDPSFFEGRTADNAVFMNGTLIFSLYRNSYFNESISNPEPFRPFLIQFSDGSGVFFPILTYENLSLDENSQVNDFFWNGKEWFCSIKKFSEAKTDFSYIKFRPETALLSISPEKNLIAIEKSSENDFRAQRSPRKFNAAPERIQNLLKSIPDGFDFYAQCRTAGGASPVDYVHSKRLGSANMHRAAAILSQTWCGALFEDGTLYLNGALYGKKILNNSRTVALRLPKLPQGYKYSDFGISGTELFAAWEETDFYKTGRAGFIEVDLEKILYDLY